MNCRSRLRTGLIRALLAPLLLCAVTPAAAADDYPFKVESRSDGRQYRLVAINGGRAPIYVKVALTKFENMDSSRPWPIRQLVAPGQTVELNRLYAADPARAYSFNFKHSWLYGDPAAKPDPNAKYRLPFADGLAFRIHQAPGGPLTTHDNIYSREAVDIIMPVGTPVVAARAGYVIVNIRPYDTGKLEPDYLDKANLVRLSAFAEIFEQCGGRHARRSRDADRAFGIQRLFKRTAFALCGAAQRRRASCVGAVPILDPCRRQLCARLHEHRHGRLWRQPCGDGGERHNSHSGAAGSTGCSASEAAPGQSLHGRQKRD